jgi:hypothetical protein
MFSRLASWALILSVALLILNDFVLKAAFHNWLTGKISDVAGLFAFALLSMVLFPTRRVEIGFAIAGAFAFWKSPYSDSWIEIWNSLGFSVGRTVDYSDWLALPMVVLAYRHSSRVPLRAVPPIVTAVIAVLSIFAFGATTCEQRCDSDGDCGPGETCTEGICEVDSEPLVTDPARVDSPSVPPSDDVAPSRPRIDVAVQEIAVPPSVNRNQEFSLTVEVQNLFLEGPAAGVVNVEVRAQLSHPTGTTNIPLGSMVFRNLEPQRSQRETIRIRSPHMPGVWILTATIRPVDFEDTANNEMEARLVVN